MKKCTKCKEFKSLASFNKRPNYNGTETIYLKSHCKICETKKTVKWIKKNRKKFNAYQRAYYHVKRQLKKQKENESIRS